MATAGLHADGRSMSLDTDIIDAASDGRIADLARLLDAHPEKLTLTGGRRNGPLLHLAAAQGHLDCVKLLLARGLDVDLRDALDRATPLLWAAAAGHLDVVKHLAELGADLDVPDDDHGIGALGWATCFDETHRDIAEYLLARGAKPTIFSAVVLGRTDLIESLVQGDHRLLHARMSPFEHRMTPLHLAVVKNQPASVVAL